ncbi:NAD(P)/FAD-dependent oxidoreductase [Marinospirillum perlucidum]|uniref:NAD(P)/FAD-dependent oxidoreductase n=1 Tax=Marinospirillum perlucidum TaxID=1982602 RepID=UPI000DF40E86|nr:NAD(P)/FAD-dependent oxidoreductase [Marinospirillum perlucidum]
MEKLDAVVIGAGVVGLAVARSLARAGREVILLEKNTRWGEETSSRNSEVIHAGLYYPAGSLKARTCVQGNRLLYQYCRDRQIQHHNCGKLIVASNAHQLAQLKQLQQTALTNTGQQLPWLDKQELTRWEPELQVEAALYSPTTGIIDSHALMQSLLADLEAAGGQLVTAQKVTGGHLTPQKKYLQIDDYEIQVELLVNAGGLWAVDLARQLHANPSWLPQAHFARGQYFSLMGKNPFSHLIYPLPEPGGLGIHLTLDLQGRARFGPDVEWLQTQDPAKLDFSVTEEARNRFAQAIQAYWPGLQPQHLQPDYAGVRPKISREAQQDFMLVGEAIHACPGVMHLLGIESPGLTASLALAEAVTQQLTATGV